MKRMQPPRSSHTLPVRPRDEEEHGIANSETWPKNAIVSAKPDGRRSSGKSVKRPFLRNFGKNGPLFIMNMITDGKWLFHLETAAQIQMNDQVSFAPEIQRSSAAAKTSAAITIQ